MAFDSLPPMINLIDRPRRPIGTVADSMDRFRTIAFGIEIMREKIRADRLNEGIDGAIWFQGIVPECYRPSVGVVVDRIFAKHRGQKMTAASVLAFVEDLNREIFATVEAIDPADVVED